jgi:hypothetical protein
MRRLRPLTEAECYARCYGASRGDDVRVVRIEPRRKRRAARLSGEDLRRLFEARLDGREGSAEAA